MLTTSVFMCLLIGTFAQTKDEPSFDDFKNSPFFDKFFEEFKKQYEELKNEKITPRPESLTTQRSAQIIDRINPSNPFFNSQSTVLPTRKPHRRPAINPSNPFFTAKPDFPRPTRRPHINPFLTSSTENSSPKRTSFVGVPTRNPAPSERPTVVQDPAEIDLRSKNSDSIEGGFLSFVQSALASSNKRSRPDARTSAEPASSVIKKLVHVKPQIKESDLLSRSGIVPQQKAEFSPEVSHSFPSRKTVAVKNSEDEFKEQAKNAEYSFTSDVQDGINGNLHQRQEVREGNKVTGMYTYEDGFFRRTVHYLADEKGYRVLKEDVEKIGNGPVIDKDGSAKIQTFIAGNAVNYQITKKDILEKHPVEYRGIEDPDYEYNQQ